MDFGKYEYQTTEGMRKCWDGEPDLSKEGWEEYEEWERFDFTEERYWRRPLTGDALVRAQQTEARIKRNEAVAVAERKVIEAAKALEALDLVTTGALDYEQRKALDTLLKRVAELLAAEGEG